MFERHNLTEWVATIWEGSYEFLQKYKCLFAPWWEPSRQNFKHVQGRRSRGGPLPWLCRVCEHRYYQYKKWQLQHRYYQYKKCGNHNTDTVNIRSGDCNTDTINTRSGDDNTDTISIRSGNYNTYTINIRSGNHTSRGQTRVFAATTTNANALWRRRELKTGETHLNPNWSKRLLCHALPLTQSGSQKKGIRLWEEPARSWTLDHHHKMMMPNHWATGQVGMHFLCFSLV